MLHCVCCCCFLLCCLNCALRAVQACNSWQMLEKDFETAGIAAEQMGLLSQKDMEYMKMKVGYAAISLSSVPTKHIAAGSAGAERHIRSLAEVFDTLNSLRSTAIRSAQGRNAEVLDALAAAKQVGDGV